MEQVHEHKVIQNQSITNDRSKQQSPVATIEDNRPETNTVKQLQSIANAANSSAVGGQTNTTGLPYQLKSGIETLSGITMDDVNVHFNSDKPAQLNAYAYAQGTDIHVAPGQEKHLPHEAWHVVQQKQGRVQPTVQTKQKIAINDDAGLEKEADVMGQKALNSQTSTPASATSNLSATTTVFQREAVTEEDVAVEALPADGNASPDLSDKPEIDSLPFDQDSTADLSRPQAQDEEFDYIENPMVTTANGYALNKGLPPEEKSLMATHGDKMVNHVSKETPLISSVLDSVKTLTKATEPSNKGKDIFEKTQNVFKNAVDNTTVSGVMTMISSLASPVISGGQAIAGAMTKWEQWKAFEKAVYVDPAAKEKTEKPKASEEAKYGLTKVWKGFLRKIKDAFMAVSNFIANLLMLIPGAQIVGGPWKIVNKLIDFTDALYKGGKGLYQLFKGEKKVQNSEAILNKALNNDADSLQLILDLRLASIAGSFDKEEKWYSMSKTKDQASSFVSAGKNKLRGLFGFNSSEGGAKRIIDIAGWGSGGPQTTEGLYDLLKIFADNPDSKKLILSELKESLTGYGT